MMRHGIAENWPPHGGDSDRQLTPRGRDRTAMVAHALRSLDLGIDTIVSSPFTRATQTADIAADILGFDGDILIDERLTPAGQFEGASDIIGELAGRDAMLFTGHEPAMGRMISGICAQGSLLIDVKKASVTAIQIMRIHPTAMGALLWALTPGMVEKILHNT